MADGDDNLAELSEEMNVRRQQRRSDGVVRSSTPKSVRVSPPKDRLPKLSAGDQVGKYEVVGPLGDARKPTGYIARDTTHDRDVELLWLAQAPEDTEALCGFSDPAIARVHELVDAPHGQFLAVERLAGNPLDEWLTAKPRSWRAVTDVLVTVGLALSHLHRRGLVHGALSPKAIVIDQDGRARVRNLGGTASAFYVAPEQLAGQAPSPESDQHALCLVAFEALFGRTPFDHGHADDLLDRKRRGDLAFPERRDLPVRLTRAIKRGLSVESAARWPSIDALARELRGCRRSAARRAAVAALLVATAAVAAPWVADMVKKTPTCDRAGARLRGIWDDNKRAEVAKVATERSEDAPWFPASWPAAQSRLDDYAESLVAGLNASCRAHYLEEAHTQAAFEVQAACYERRLIALHTLTSLLVRGDESALEHAVGSVDALLPLELCTDATVLSTALDAPPPAAHARTVARLRDRIARAHSLRHAGHPDDALQLASDLVSRAQATGYGPVIAEANLLLGELEQASAEHERAYEHLKDAYFLGVDASRLRVAADAAIRLSLLASLEFERHDEAMQWTEHAAAALEDLGGHPHLESQRLEALGRLLTAAGRPSDALAALTDAKARHLEASASASFAARIDLATGDAQAQLGDKTGALQSYESALAGQRHLFGAGHPVTTHALTRVLSAARRADKLARAQELVPPALELTTNAAPSVPTAMLELALADTALAASQLDEARTRYNTAAQVLTLATESDHELLGLAELGLGRLARERDDRETAEQHFERALEYFSLGDEQLEPEIETCMELAELALKRRDRSTATEFGRRARALVRSRAYRHLERQFETWRAAVGIAVD
ncbi:MAG: tetratricopeptide repeat protein [Myxococcales bacterium FL481]|nr:MAG: tetratricopeptide repeat protein [Myxococcales bacterium FL481]